MSSVVNKEKKKIFETILSSPGMNEKCKIVLQISRQQVLLLSRLIEHGLLNKDEVYKDELIEAFPTDSIDGFKLIHEEILKKAELSEFYDRMKSL